MLQSDTSAAAIAAATADNTKRTVDPDSPGADRLDGVPQIATFMGVSERVARYKLSKGLWPYTMEGQRYIASKRALTKHWVKSTGGTPAAESKPAEVA
jgi:hypothetical protein